jgi:hypothetical protein
MATTKEDKCQGHHQKGPNTSPWLGHIGNTYRSVHVFSAIVGHHRDASPVDSGAIAIRSVNLGFNCIALKES